MSYLCSLVLYHEHKENVWIKIRSLPYYYAKIQSILWQHKDLNDRKIKSHREMDDLRYIQINPNKHNVSSDSGCAKPQRLEPSDSPYIWSYVYNLKKAVFWNDERLLMYVFIIFFFFFFFRGIKFTHTLVYSNEIKNDPSK